MPVEISLIVPTFDRCASVERLLNCVSKQTLPCDQFEVIVVVDGSSDATMEMLADYPAKYPLRKIWQPNRGRASACNVGIRAAAGKVIVLLDDDMEPQPGFLAAHLEPHRRVKNIGILGAVPAQLEENSEPIVQYSASKFNAHLNRLAQSKTPVRVRDFYSGNFSISKENIIQVGLFDEEFRLYGNEDLDLYIRLARSGVNFSYAPDALALQHIEKDIYTLANDNLAKGKTALILARKHPDTISEQKLGMKLSESPRWRMATDLLLWLSLRFPFFPQFIISMIQQVERINSRYLFLFYRFTLDYFFWLGTQDDKNRVVLHR